jgi:hypothetical protein
MPAIFGLTVANHVILSITGYPLDYVPAKGREKMYEGILATIQSYEEKLARLTFEGDTVGLKVPINVGDVAFLSEELYRGRSAISGIPTKLVLIRWEKPSTPSMTTLGEGKDIQKCSTVKFNDLVLMTKEEATRHEKEIFKGGKSIEEVYDAETIARVEEKRKTAEKYEAFRG